MSETSAAPPDEAPIAEPQPPPRADHHRRADAGDVPGGARSDDRLDRAAHDRRRPARRLAPGLDRGGLPAGRDRVDAAVGQARRPVRAQVLLPGGDRHLPVRLGAVGAEPLADRADRVPGHAGSRRRRADGRRAGDRRRHRLAARTRSLPGAVRGGVRRGEHHRSAARRRVRRSAVLALDLLHQPADRRGRARGRGDPGARQPPPRAPRHRLSRDRRADGVGRLPGAVHQSRRHDLSVGLDADRRVRGRGRGAARRVRPGRAPGGRAGAAAAPVLASGRSRSPASSASSSALPCSARSPTCRCSSRSCTASRRRSRGCSCCRCSSAWCSSPPDRGSSSPGPGATACSRSSAPRSSPRRWCSSRR